MNLPPFKLASILNRHWKNKVHEVVVRNLDYSAKTHVKMPRMDDTLAVYKSLS
jgi:hypothetical protein